MVQKDFPVLVGVYDLVGSSTQRRIVNIQIPDHLVNHDTRVVTILVKNRTDKDMYMKEVGEADSNAMIFFAKESEAFEFTPLRHTVGVEIWSTVDPLNGEFVYITREG